MWKSMIITKQVSDKQWKYLKYTYIILIEIEEILQDSLFLQYT